MILEAPLSIEESFKKLERELSNEDFQYIPTDDDYERYLKEFNKDINQPIEAVESFSKKCRSEAELRKRLEEIKEELIKNPHDPVLHWERDTILCELDEFYWITENGLKIPKLRPQYM